MECRCVQFFFVAAIYFYFFLELKCLFPSSKGLVIFRAGVFVADAHGT